MKRCRLCEMHIHPEWGDIHLRVDMHKICLEQIIASLNHVVWEDQYERSDMSKPVEEGD